MTRHLKPTAGPGAPDVQGWDRLELGQRTAGMLPGKTHFGTPTGGGSRLAGDVTIDVDE